MVSRVAGTAAVGLLLLLAGGPASGGSARPAVGQPAPDFALPALGSKAVRLSDFFEKKAVLLNFWATWCAPCRQEMPTLERAYREYRAKGLEILGISIDRGPEAAAAAAVRKFRAKVKFSFPVLLDHEMKVAKQYRILGVPSTFLIDRHGVIRAVEIGQRDWFTPESRRKLENLLRPRLPVGYPDGARDHLAGGTPARGKRPTVRSSGDPEAEEIEHRGLLSDLQLYSLPPAKRTFHLLSGADKVCAPYGRNG